MESTLSRIIHTQIILLYLFKIFSTSLRSGLANLSQMIQTQIILLYLFKIFSTSLRSGLANLWHVCPKCHSEKIPWHTAFTAIPFFFNFARSAPIYVKNICIHTHTWRCTNSVKSTVVTKWHCEWKKFTQIGSVAKCWLDICHSAPVWRLLGEYVTLDKTFKDLFKQEVVVAAVTSISSSLSPSLCKPY